MAWRSQIVKMDKVMMTIPAWLYCMCLELTSRKKAWNWGCKFLWIDRHFGMPLAIDHPFVSSTVCDSNMAALNEKAESILKFKQQWWDKTSTSISFRTPVLSMRTKGLKARLRFGTCMPNTKSLKNMWHLKQDSCFWADLDSWFSLLLSQWIRIIIIWFVYQECVASFFHCGLLLCG